MSKYTFGEKQIEYHSTYGEIPVWKSPKYEAAKAKAIEVIDSNKYGLTEGDFWILMNATKSQKMAYTGLIISHNGCLKINDTLESKFNPSCVTIEQNGYKDELVFIYCNEEQGIFEVGEVSKTNCKNDYPYAMALKRCFDRVVLKLCKLAYDGIYSDSESDEFVQRQEETPKTPDADATDYRQILVDYCKENNVDMKEIAKAYNLNGKSTQEDFKKAIEDLEV